MREVIFMRRRSRDVGYYAKGEMFTSVAASPHDLVHSNLRSFAKVEGRKGEREREREEYKGRERKAVA